jgi:mannosyltransferase
MRAHGYAGPMSPMRYKLGLLAVVALGAWLRCGELGREGLWLDELYTVRLAGREGFAQVIEELKHDLHPPLYFLVMQLWSHVAVSDALWRVPSVLAGLGGLVAAATLGHRLHGPLAGLIGAALVATAPVAVDLDREVRGNAWLAALALTLGALLAGDRGRRWPELVAVGAASAAICWTHPFGPLVVLGLLAWWTLLQTSQPGSRAWPVALIFGPVSLVPWLGVLYGQVSAYCEDPWYQPPGSDGLGWIWAELFDGQLGPAVLAIGGLFLLVRADDAAGRRALGLLAAMIGALVLLPELVSWVAVPILRARSALPLLGFGLVAAGIGFAGGGRSAQGVAVLLVFAQGLGTWQLTRGALRREQWREAAASVNAAASDGLLVVANHAQLWRHYLPETISLRDANEPGIDGADRLWLLWGHSRPDGYDSWGEGATIESDAALYGAGARLLRPGPRALALERLVGEDPAALADGELHFWWGRAMRSDDLRLRGRCGLAIEAYGESAGGVRPILVMRLIEEGRVVAEKGVALDPTPARFEAPPTDFALYGEPGARSVQAELEFINDGVHQGEAGVEDRNAHVRGVWVHCS